MKSVHRFTVTISDKRRKELGGIEEAKSLLQREANNLLKMFSGNSVEMYDESCRTRTQGMETRVTLIYTPKRLGRKE
jgi:hypothetical protein